MDTNLLARKRFRKRFGNIPEILDIPNLIITSSKNGGLGKLVIFLK